jgi:hypothetical protein
MQFEFWVTWVVISCVGIKKGCLKEWANHVLARDWTSWVTLTEQVMIDHIENKKVCHKLKFSLWQ